MFNAFIEKLEGFLDTTRTEINLTAMWAETSPLIANVSNPPPPLSKVLNTTYADLITLDQIALVADPFIADFKVARNGQSPFIDPAPLARWTYGRSLPAGRKEEAVTNKTVFMNWFQDRVLNGTNKETCSNSIYLYPQSSGGTNYRNRYIRCVFYRNHSVSSMLNKIFIALPPRHLVSAQVVSLSTRRYPTWSSPVRRCVHALSLRVLTRAIL